MPCRDQKPNGLPQPRLLPFSARTRCYLGNLGYSRTIYERSDFGVNRARVEAWLAGLCQSLGGAAAPCF